MKSQKAARISPASTEKARKEAIVEIQARLNAPPDSAVAGDAAPGGVPSPEGEVVAKAGSPAPRKPTSGAKGKTPKAKKGAKPAPEKKPAKPRAPKRLSCIDAAAKVLAEAKKPMRATEMIVVMGKKGLWTSPKGKTPEASLYAAIIREIRDKGAEARFVKVARGEFAAAKN